MPPREIFSVQPSSPPVLPTGPVQGCAGFVSQGSDCPSYGIRVFLGVLLQSVFGPEDGWDLPTAEPQGPESLSVGTDVQDGIHPFGGVLHTFIFLHP